MKYRNKLFSALVALSFCGTVFAQGAAVIRGEISAGNYGNFKTDASGNMYVITGTPAAGGSSQVTSVSTVNSSTTPLGSSATFTGTSEDCSNFAEMRVSVFANQASATDGLSIQQSSDGTNWDNTDIYTVPASTGKVFGSGIGSRFCRVVYTNSASAQAAFRLTTTYHSVRTKPSAARPQDARTNDNDFEEMLAYNMLYNGTSWDRARGDSTAGLWVQLRSSATGGYAFLRLNANATTTIKSGAGTLHSVIVGTLGTTSTVTCYDSLTATGTVILNATTVLQANLMFDSAFSTGLTCVTAGGVAADLTVTYR